MAGEVPRQQVAENAIYLSPKIDTSTETRTRTPKLTKLEKLTVQPPPPPTVPS